MSERNVDKALYEEIRKVPNLPDDQQAAAIRDLARRIRQRPKDNIVVLASNLEISVGETTSPSLETLQDVASTLGEALQKAPQDDTSPEYLHLAKLARYDHVLVSLDDPRFAAAVSRLVADEQHVSEASFKLQDTAGRQWELKSLRGRVVLVNFWATWCPPCKKEIPILAELHERFSTRGLVILAITQEASSVVKPLLAGLRIPYPVLLDPEGEVQKLYLVDGIPQTFVYNRAGRLSGETNNTPTMEGFVELLKQAGLQ